MPEGSPTPWSYFLIRLLFKFVLKIFYGTIVVENAHLIPKRGEPCIVSANHSNSLTDALILVASIPWKSRNLLRLTAKSTQFGKKTFTSWLIESAGTVPLQRRKDYPDGRVDNSQVMKYLIEALELGDAVCLFPEGMSRYHPTIAPLKTGVARLVSDVLSRNRDKPDFEISVVTCSITYMHRQHFRSDVLVTFHAPMKFTPRTNPELLSPVDYSNIRSLTAKMHQQISAGTLDAPSWRLVRNAKLAAKIYAPVGTEMSLGDYVRLVRTFLDAFKVAESSVNGGSGGNTSAPQQILSGSDGEAQIREGDGASRERREEEDKKIVRLSDDLKDYQDQLSRLGIKDDRIRKPLPRIIMLYRLIVRLIWAMTLFTISLPGLLLWIPIFITTFIAVRKFKRTGPIWDTFDEIAQYKLVYGLISGLCVWFSITLLTLPFAIFTFFGIPVLMWMSLRWMEDSVSAFRAFVSLWRLLWVGKKRLVEMQKVRKDLYGRVRELAVETLGLPEDPEKHFVEAGHGKEKGRVRGRWAFGAKYFSVRRRRKRDWNETLRLYDKVDYPEDY
ncbi:Phospholipid/glycerol acyltransferase domain-containing protein [Abortiporus biennis]